ncbi:MAG: tetratricopeptide repeat protein [Gammaproteobacteria bacterium]|nr:tetratricopeptide repeat protein [Gammaproteobacteria bacterium]
MNSPKAPEILQIPVAEFDVSTLPANARTPGTEAFEQAVLTYLALRYAERGWAAAVTVDDGYIRVVAVPEQGVEPKHYVIGLLQHGFLEDALPMLEALYGMLDDPDIAYNYGICLSELGRTDECIEPLKHCLRLDPTYAHSAVGLGVAYARSGRDEEAAETLRNALELQPGDAFALRNLAAVLGRQGKLAEALPLFRQAVAAAPDQPEALYNLAQCLEQLGGGHRGEAEALYKKLIQKFPQHAVGDAAIKAANRMSNEDLHRAVDGKPRPDAIQYMLGAMETFAKLPREKSGEVVMEIAKLGQSGLSINEPGKRHTLQALPGDYSGLQLLCLMHVGFRLFDPNTDPGTGLQREYEIAKGMQSKPK